MFRAIYFQLLATVIVAALAGTFVGWRGAVSAAAESGTGERMANSSPRLREAVRVIETSPPFPENSLVVAAGMDAKEHAGFCEPRGDGLIYDDLVQLYRTAGIGVVPTIAYSSFAVHLNEHPDLLDADSALAPFLLPRSSFGWMLQLDAARRQQFARFAQQARAATVKLARAGVTIGTGTDIWQIPTGVHLELEELVAAGLSPLEAIHAATGGAARIVGAEGDLGTIAVGKLADLVLLDADPVADIHNTRRIRAVIQAGRVVDRPGIVERFRHP